MHQALGAVERFGLANLVEIGGVRGAIDHHRHDAERAPDPKRLLARLRPLGGRNTSRQRVDRGRCSRWRHRRVPRGAALAAALDQQREAFAFGLRAHPHHVAVVHGLLKPAVRRAALQERAAPARDRQVRHGGEYRNARHQRAPKAEALRHGVVVDLVLGRRRAVVGADFVSGGQWRCHGISRSTSGICGRSFRGGAQAWPYSHIHGMVSHMKTTLNIDDTVMAELKREAARQGRTMSELVETGPPAAASFAAEARRLARLPAFMVERSSSILLIATLSIRRWKAASVARGHQCAGLRGQHSLQVP